MTDAIHSLRRRPVFVHHASEAAAVLQPPPSTVLTRLSPDVFETAQPTRSAATSTVVVRRGMTGPEVDAWQRMLIRLGYLTPAAYATGRGIFGPATERATRVFQR